MSKVTAYNEVADELVKDIQNDGDEADKDHKNIRRRVYDALNVLMVSMAYADVISGVMNRRWISLRRIRRTSDG